MSMNRIYEAVHTDEHLYSLSLAQDDEHCHFNFTMRFPCLNTKELPHVYSTLKQDLPTILMSQCFNDAHLPFKEEVSHTEIGHLFEHILLEYLCLAKLSDGYQNVEYEGKTSWNWEKEELGVFHIVIDVPASEAVYLKNALADTNKLMDKILLTAKV